MLIVPELVYTYQLISKINCKNKKTNYNNMQSFKAVVGSLFFA